VTFSVLVDILNFGRFSFSGVLYDVWLFSSLLVINCLFFCWSAKQLAATTTPAV
jgi:hypothetical protein